MIMNQQNDNFTYNQKYNNDDDAIAIAVLDGGEMKGAGRVKIIESYGNEEKEGEDENVKDDDYDEEQEKDENEENLMLSDSNRLSASTSSSTNQDDNEKGYEKENDVSNEEEDEEDDEILEEANDNQNQEQQLQNDSLSLSPYLAQTTKEYIQASKRKLENKIQQLEQMEPIPFYIYDHPNITLVDIKLNMVDRMLHRIGSESLFDMATIHTLNMSSWKTNDPDKARLFIIPTPIGRISCSRQHNYFDVAFSTLLKEPLFQSTYGHDHVLPGSPFLLFRGDKKGQHGKMTTWMPHLWNVTVASSYDQNAVVNAIRDGTNFDEYTPSFAKLNALNKRTFSIGLTGGTNFPLRDIHSPHQLEPYEFPLTLATTEKFYNSSNFIFYHTPANFTCFHNSTIHRMAPVTNITFESFPKSSIGHGVKPWDLWIDTYKDSKFCLCIRGDSPHSHAFFRSIRSGCIPVVSSATLPIWSPILKHTLDMSEYTIMLDEQELIQNTQDMLLKLQDLDEEYIETKIKNLQFAQRVWFQDHPESLFVRSYLYEALHASEVDDSLSPYGVRKWR